MTPKLCLCCICGNEARYARRFLETFRPYVDALVVVRACGSATPDNTLDLAKEFGCITGEYKNAPANADWPHVDHFGAARQMSFDLAPADCDWLVWADFDDTATPQSLIALRQHAASQGDKADWFHAPYHMPNGQVTWRERMIRRGTGKWIFRIHEHLAEMQNDEAKINLVDWGLPDAQSDLSRVETREATPAPRSTRRLRLGDVQWFHEPDDYKESSHTRNVAILTRYAAEHSHYVYYLHVDHFLHVGAAATEEERLTDRMNAIAYGQRYLEMRDRAPVFEYNVLLSLTQLAFTFQERQTYGWRAFRLCPWLREVVIILCEQAIEINKPITARSLARLFSAIPKPGLDLAPYYLRPEWYGWAGVDLYARVARFCLDEENARLNETKMLEQGGRKISLLHATRGRPAKAADTRNKWLHRAAQPEGIEHIFAIDEDDAESIAGLRQYRKVIVGITDSTGDRRERGENPTSANSAASCENPAPKRSGCVQAWNRAAAESCCAVIVQLSDDWDPPVGWDEMILDRIGDASKPAVLAISDGHRKDGLLCMAVLTRARYEAQTDGSSSRPYLFHPDYTGVFSDNEFTDRAYADGVVIEARDIVFEHQHPLLTGDEKAWDATYHAQNAPERYAEGRAIYERRKTDFAQAPRSPRPPVKSDSETPP